MIDRRIFIMRIFAMRHVHRHRLRQRIDLQIGHGILRVLTPRVLVNKYSGQVSTSSLGFANNSFHF